MLMDQQHPITPPPELVQQWCRNWTHAHGEFGVYLATQAARWGADQELEACREWASQFNYDDYRYQDELRDVRRPKPPSLAEQALEACERSAFGVPGDRDIVHRALERLQQLEKGNE